jgi:hypothetical protein
LHLLTEALALAVAPQQDILVVEVAVGRKVIQVHRQAALEVLEAVEEVRWSILLGLFLRHH